MTEFENVQTPTAETNSMSPWSMLVNVLFSPTKVFQVVREKPAWVIPFVVILLIFTATAWIITPMAMKHGHEIMMQSDRYTPEEKAQAEQNYEIGQKFGRIIGVITAPIMWGIIIVICAGLLILMGNVLLGGAARFAQILTIVCLSFMTWVISTIVKLPLMLAKDSIDIRTSLALMLPSDLKTLESPLYSFLNTYTDVFIIWQIILLIIGVKVLYNFQTGRAAMAVLIPVAVLALISTGLSMAF